MMNNRPVLSLLCLTVLALLARPAAAQTSAKERVADELLRSSLVSMGAATVINSGDPYILAEALLDAALELDPDNADAWWVRSRVASASGDVDIYDKSLVGYLGTGIKDDRARYDLIVHRLTQNNDTIDAQLVDLERMLTGDASRGMSGPLRSRLASLACAYAAEIGEEKSRRKWAVEAARSDPANAQAANEMWLLVTELSDDPVRIGTATINRVRASPLDPGARILLANILYEQQAYARAVQQYNVVANRLPYTANPADILKHVFSTVALGDDAASLQLIDNIQQAMAAKAQAQRDAAAGETPDQPQANDPLDNVIGLELELVRLALMDGDDNNAESASSLGRLETFLVNSENATDSSKELYAVCAAALASNLDRAESIAKELPAGLPNRDIAMGWVAIRREQYKKAEALFAPHLKEGRPMAQVGSAFAKGQDAAGRARLVNEAITPNTTLVAMLAATRHLQKAGQRLESTPKGEALTNLMAKHPEAFWLIDLERTPWLDVRMKIDPRRIKPYEPVVAQITLWNTSRFPLAISDAGPIFPVAAITLTASSSGQPQPPFEPIQVRLDRVFTLKAGERLIIDARLDYERFGRLRIANAGAPFIIDTRLIVNPYTTVAGGNVLAEGIGETSDVRDTLVEAKPATAKDIDVWIPNLTSKDPVLKLEAITRLSGLSSNIQVGLVNAKVLERVTGPLLKAWDDGSEAERALMVVNAIALDQGGTSFPGLLERATASDSRLVWLALLSKHVTESNSKLLTTAIQEKQGVRGLSRYADRLRRTLEKMEELRAEQENVQPAPGQ